MTDLWKHARFWKKPDTKEQILHDSIYIKCPKCENQDGNTEKESSLVVGRGREKRYGEWLNGYEISLGEVMNMFWN